MNTLTAVVAVTAVIVAAVTNTYVANTADSPPKPTLHSSCNDEQRFPDRGGVSQPHLQLSIDHTTPTMLSPLEWGWKGCALVPGSALTHWA